MGGGAEAMDVEVEAMTEEEDVDMDDEEFFDEDDDRDEDDDNDEDFNVEDDDEPDDDELVDAKAEELGTPPKRQETRKPRLRASMEQLRRPGLTVKAKVSTREERTPDKTVGDEIEVESGGEGATAAGEEVAAAHPQETEEEKAEKARQEQAKRDESWRKYLIGELGRSRIIEALSSSDSPFRAIEEFKVDNGLRTPLADVKSFYPVMELLDLHGVTRTDLYKQLLSGMVQLVLKRCTASAPAPDAVATAAAAGAAQSAAAPPAAAAAAAPGGEMATGTAAASAAVASALPAMTTKDRDRMLKETFPYIGFEELQEVPFTLLEQTPVIPKPFLRQLAANPSLYATSPVKVKRQIWETEEALFVREVQPLLDQYVSTAIVNPPDLSESAVLPKKRRDKDPVVKQLVQWVGNSLQLYTSLVKFCSQLFLATGHTHYCNLRAELLMALHDNGISAIYEKDPCHQVAWYLDACVGDASVEMRERRIAEVMTLLEAVPSGSSILGDMAMIVASSHAIDVLARTIFHRIVDAVDRQALPRSDARLKRVTALAALGSQAFTVLSKQQFRLPKVERELLQNGFVFVGQLLVDDRLREAGDPPEEPAKPGEKFRKVFFSNGLSRQVCWRYLLSRLAAGDAESPKAVMKLASELGASINAEAPFLHSVVTLSTVGRSAPVREAVIDNWLLEMNGELIVHMELLHFLISHHTVLSAKEFFSYLERICAYRTQEVAAANLALRLVEQLRDRVGNRISEHATPFFFEYLRCLQDPSSVKTAAPAAPKEASDGKEEEDREEEEEDKEQEGDKEQEEDKESADVDIETEEGEINESAGSEPMDVDG